MKTLLRSTFIYAKDDDPALFLRNYLMLTEAELGFDTAADILIWEYIQQFVQRHNHVPEYATLTQNFNLKKQNEALDRLETVAKLPAITQGDFESRVENKAAERRTRRAGEVLKEAITILQTGMEVPDGKQKKTMFGPIDSMRYVLDMSPDIVAPTLGANLSGEATRDGDNVRKEYELVESDPLAGIGQYTGLPQMDVVVGGAKRHELWIHAAFTGGLKSTFMLNWAYKQAIYFRHSSALFSLEMPYKQCRRILYALHSAHEKFRPIRHQLGLQQDPQATLGLNYADIRDGKLTPEAKKFLFEYVIPDYKDETNKYGRIHIEVSDPDKSDFTVADLRQRAELIYSNAPFASLFVDHAGLMAPRKWVSNTTERLNEVIRDLKRLAMSFNRGQGMATIGLFQIGREGYKRVKKSREGGVRAEYNPTDLSYSNECCKYTTPLRFSRGVLPIAEARVGDKVWSGTGWKDVLAVFPQGPRPIWELTTDRGSVLEATADHRVRVIRDEALDWERLDKLQSGDWLVGALGGGFPEGPVTLPSAWAGASTLTEDLAYLLGAWHGDGRVRPNSVAFTGNRLEVAVEERLVQTLKQVQGSKEPAQYHFKSRSGSFDLEMYDTEFMHWFEGIAGARGQVVPDAVLQAPRPQVLAFLRGLFDTDGCINSIGVVSLSSKHETFLRQVQSLMTACGLDTYLSSRPTCLKKTQKTYTGWYLNVRGWVSLTRFGDLIGFTDTQKAQRLATRVQTLPLRKRSDQAYPFAALFEALVKEHLPYSFIKKGLVRESLHVKLRQFRKRGSVAEDTIRYVLERLEHLGIRDPRADFFQEVLDTWHVMQVQSVKPTGQVEEVYDLEVGGDHEYQTGPLLSHNCERSADIITATWIDKTLREQNRVEFQCLKSRDQAPFETFLARVEWPCRAIIPCWDMPVTPTASGASSKKQAEIDAAADALSK